MLVLPQALSVQHARNPSYVPNNDASTALVNTTRFQGLMVYYPETGPSHTNFLSAPRKSVSGPFCLKVKPYLVLATAVVKAETSRRDLILLLLINVPYYVLVRRRQHGYTLTVF